MRNPSSHRTRRTGIGITLGGLLLAVATGGASGQITYLGANRSLFAYAQNPAPTGPPSGTDQFSTNSLEYLNRSVGVGFVGAGAGASQVSSFAPDQIFCESQVSAGALNAYQATASATFQVSFSITTPSPFAFRGNYPGVQLSGNGRDWITARETYGTLPAGTYSMSHSISYSNSPGPDPPSVSSGFVLTIPSPGVAFAVAIALLAVCRRRTL